MARTERPPEIWSRPQGGEINMYKAEIYITLKEGVLDPQGSAVEKHCIP